MTLRRFSTSGISTGTKSHKLWDGETFPGYFESIATVIVGSAGQATVEFTNIPDSYTHLQIRYLAREESGGGTNAAQQLVVRFNGDSESNYSLHRLFGNGSTASSDGYTSLTGIRVSGLNGSSATASSFAGGIIDILDYANTNKYTTVRSLAGCDLNDTNGFIFLSSGAWLDTLNTNAITSITITNLSAVDFNKNSHFALYGIRSA